MSQREMLRFCRPELEQHADSYCSREARLCNELTDLLRAAAIFAPAGSIPRLRRLMTDADRMAQYFSAMKNTLYEAGEQVEATSQAVLERLEDATADVSRLLR